MNLSKKIQRKQSTDQGINDDQYRVIVENAKEAIMILQRGKRVYVNTAWLDITEYSAEEYEKTDFLALIHPDDLEMVISKYNGLLSSDSFSEIFIFQIISRTGKIKYIETKASSIQWEGEYAVLIFATDITEQKKSEEILKESEEKYRLLHENAALGIGYYTPEGIVISYNSIAAKDMNGIPDDFAGKSLFDLFPKELADIYFGRLQTAVHTDETVTYEDLVELPKEKKWFLSTYTKIVNSENKILGIQIISQNITALKESRLALEESEEKYNVLADNMNIGLILHGADTSILLTNQRASDILGVPSDKLLGKKADSDEWGFIEENGDDMLVERYPVNQIITTQKALYGFIIGIKNYKHHEIGWGLVNGMPVFDQAGQIKYVSITFEDITERKHVEDELKKYRGQLEELVEDRTKELETKMKEKTALFDMMVGREVRMNDLKKVIKSLRQQLKDYGINPIANDPMLKDDEEY